MDGRRSKNDGCQAGQLQDPSDGQSERESGSLRVVGHAVACAHMREHAMVASDYAVKVISLLHPDCMESVREERLWQIHHLQEVKSTNE